MFQYSIRLTSRVRRQWLGALAGCLLALPSTAQVPADSAAPGRRSDYAVAPGLTYHYERPRPFQWLYHIPRDVGQLPGYAGQRSHLPVLAGVAGATVGLWLADQAIIDNGQRLGRHLGLANQDRQKALVNIPFRVGSVRLPIQFNVPDNLNTCFYYLGDGWTHLAIASSFWAYGGLKKDNRALQVSSQLGEAVLSTGLVVQVLKHLTGRQSPYVATKRRGDWDLLPAYHDYQNFVPNYDAFPSGHLATAMATVTVLADNYPEHRYIRPVGYSLMGVLGYAMLNNGVHWASDYPLGIALGYGMAKIAVRHGHTRLVGGGTAAAGQPRRRWWRQPHLSPLLAGNGLTVQWQL